MKHLREINRNGIAIKKKHETGVFLMRPIHWYNFKIFSLDGDDQNPAAEIPTRNAAMAMNMASIIRNLATGTLWLVRLPR